MLKSLFSFRPGSVVTLVPDTGVQFIDFGIGDEDIRDVSRVFWSEEKTNERDDDGHVAVDLHILEKDSEGTYFYRLPGGTLAAAPEDDIFTVRAERALEVLGGLWLPLPFLRKKEAGSDGIADYDTGPMNWVRVHVTRLETPDADGNTWRVVMGFDTELLERPADNRYVAPEPLDCESNARFCLVDEPAAIKFFILTDWVRGWLKSAYLKAETQRRKARKLLTIDELRNPGEYWAFYLVLVETLRKAINPPPVRFIHQGLISKDNRPVPVDLAIDVGNSRTCGIFIEDTEDTNVLDMSQAYRLELRDLSAPAQTYSDPFESRLEFYPAAFGPAEFSRRSRRPKRDAFWWPSPVRVGPEAMRLSSQNDGTQGQSGLSSPKRYLWDTSARPQAWVNNPASALRPDEVPPIKSPVTSRLTEKGERVRPGSTTHIVGMEPKYSRSSMYTLMLVEILIHAIAQINSPVSRSQRAQSDRPRRLRRIILTLPSATPVAEQKVMRKRVRDAVDLVWQVMDWDPKDLIHEKPKIIIDWDEATATHLVYLYNEILQKFQGAPRDFFSLMSRERSHDGSQLRIASMDIGGGTTDLMIIEHEMEGDSTIVPRQVFREGFRLAGDDIVKHIIEDAVLPCVAHALREAGVSSPSKLLVDLFGSDRGEMTQQEQTLRGLFVNQVLRRAAIALLGAYEATDMRRPNPPLDIPLGDTFDPDHPPHQAVRGYVEDAVRRAGAADFKLESVRLVMNPEDMASYIRSVISGVVYDLCDVVRAYHCDILLLSGRPSRLPIVSELILETVPVPPNRMIRMGEYEVGNWYPFHSSLFRIEDPKTTAAVGAMLCHICEGGVQGMIMRSSEIKMRSTARFVGFMEINDQIPDKNLVFSDLDLDRSQAATSNSVAVTPPRFLGYRQLPLERWITTPLYYMPFTNRQAVRQLKMPLTVTLERTLPQGDDEEEKFEEFVIRDARDANDVGCEEAVRLNFQTLRTETEREAGYWLDSGVLTIET